MKIKYLIMVGLILAVLTIGAVSASDDANNLTADDAQGDSIQEIPEDDGVLKDPADDYEKHIDVPDEIVMVEGQFYGHVSVELPNDAVGNISAYLDDDDSPFYNEEYHDYAEIYFTDVGLTFSDHTLKLNYTGDSNYAGFQKTYQFNATYDLSFSRETYSRFGEDVTVDVAAPYIEGNVTFLMNGKSYPFTIDETTWYGYYLYQFALSDLNFGVNNFTITVSNDPVYPNKSFKGAVILYSDILIDFPNHEWGDFMRYGDDGNITLSLPGDAKGTLNVTIDGRQIADATSSDGKFYVPLPRLDVGNHTIIANYTGNDYHVGAIENSEFSVVPFVSVPKFIYTESEENYTITVVLNDNASGELNITIRDDGYYALHYERQIYSGVPNGTVKVNMPKFTGGDEGYRALVTYDNVAVRYEGNPYFRFETRSKNPNFDLNVTFPDKVEMGKNVKLVLNNAPMEGRYSVLVNGKEYPLEDVYSDSLAFSSHGMLFGENNVTVIFEDREGYYNTTSASGKIRIELRGVPDEISYDNGIYVDVGEYEGFVNLKIDGRNFETQFIDGFGVYFDICQLNFGHHTYEITFFDKNNVKIANKSGSFNMTYEISTNIWVTNYPWVKEFELDVFVPEDATGTIMVSVGDKNYTATPDWGAATVVITNLVMGENNVTVSLVGDDKYPVKEIKNVINCEGYAFDVEGYHYSFYDPSPYNLVYISLLLPEDAIGNITLYEAQYQDGYWQAGDKIKSVKLENGYAKIWGTEFGFDEKHIIAKYESEDGYSVEDVTVHFKNLPKIDVDTDVVVGQNASISVEMDATGNVTVYKEDGPDGSKCIAVIPFIDGKAQGNITLSIGNHVILLEYEGTDFNNPFGEYGYEYSLIVNPLNFEIPYDFETDGKGEIILELPEGITGKVSIYEQFDADPDVVLIKDEVYTSENKTIAISLTQGYHRLKLEFTDDKTGDIYSGVGDAYVPKPASDESVSIPETVYDDVIDITLPKDATGGILVTIDDDTTYIPLVNGSTKIDLSELAKGNHTISLKYLGDDNYGGFEKTFNVAVKDPVDPNLSISVANITEGDPAVVTITTDAAFTGNVTVRIGNANYTVSVLNGKGTLNVPGLAVGTYNATAIFSAQTGFIESVRNTTFTVSKKQPVTPAPTPAKKDVIKLTLKKVKVKRSAKKLVIKATLKINGKAVKGKVIKFKFNKKTYKAKTDKKGIAKITVKKSVLKKLKAGKKVKYQATYGKVTKKYTVKVKK